MKWARGKARLANALLARAPVQFETYHEPFLGGGAIFFRLYREKRIRRAVLSDVNAELIATYRAIRDAVEEVIAILTTNPYSKDFYYALRAKDPWALSPPERAACMIYLNKTGYNGLYRVNRKGQFNVPFGRYKAPKYLDPDNLRAVSAALQRVEILCASFEETVARACPGDWVYFDPPYVPLSKTADFTAYQAGGFGLEDQERLRDVCLALTENKVAVMLSNSDTPIVRELYRDERFVIEEVLANRAINANGARRGKITELVITNYPPARERQLRLLEQGAPYLVP